MSQNDAAYPAPVFPSLGRPEDSITRNLVILVLDTSGSMGSKPAGSNQSRIEELQEALQFFFSEGLHKISPLEQNGEIAVATFSAEEVTWLHLADKAAISEYPFYYAQYVKSAPALAADGGTPMGKAVLEVLDVLAQRKRALKAAGYMHEYRPNVFLLSDGAPTDTIEAAIQRRHVAEEERQLLFFALGTGAANDEVMRQIARPDAYYPIKDKPLHAYIEFLSRSLEAQQSGDIEETVDVTYDRVKSSMSQDDAVDAWGEE